MRTYDAPFLADWFAVLFRWIVLTGAAIVAALTGWFTIFTAGLLIISAIWSAVISILAILNKRFTSQRILNVIIDFLVGSALFTLSGGLAGSLFWIGFLPIITAGIYYEWKGAIWTGILVFLVQATWTVFGVGYGFERYYWLGYALAADIVVSVLVGWLSHKLLTRLRAKYQALVQQRKDAEEYTRQHERDQIQKFYSLTENLSTTLDYHEVLNTILDLCVSAMGEPQSQAEQMSRAVLLYGEGELIVACSRRFSSHDQKTTLPGSQGALSEVITKGEPVWVGDPASDPELSRLVAIQVCKAAFCLPLMRGSGFLWGSSPGTP